jgi:hypothetical protein
VFNGFRHPAGKQKDGLSSVALPSWFIRPAVNLHDESITALKLNIAAGCGLILRADLTTSSVFVGAQNAR